MKVGITELLKSGNREFSDTELLRCLENALEIFPLGEVYRRAKVLEPFPSEIRSSKPPEGASFLGWVNDVYGTARELIVNQGKNVRRKYGVDALVFALGKDPRLGPYAFAWPELFGRGEALVSNPGYPPVLAHELGHLWGLGHHYPDGEREECVMHVAGGLVVRADEVNHFSPRNQKTILQRYREERGIGGRLRRLLR
ncbi:MAG: hypothetical protein HYS53_01185 [Candidatus Aenigmarchaeota archaeon]|nr:hypothetical protein [Candidatus Aenigmarchaeota archaeon]